MRILRAFLRAGVHNLLTTVHKVEVPTLWGTVCGRAAPTPLPKVLGSGLHRGVRYTVHS